MRKVTMRRPDDFHVHFRSEEMLEHVVPYTSWVCGRATVMPNPDPPILDAVGVAMYRDEILKVTRPFSPHFTPLMTIMVTEETTPQTIYDCREVGTVAGKIYPLGQTNSKIGVSNYNRLGEVFAAMADAGMLLLLHGETPDPEIFCLDREEAFLSILRRISADHPTLRIVLEHVSTAAAVRCVKELSDNVAATITPHHMLLTLDDVIGDKLHVHQFCKPVAKRPEDRDAVRDAAMSGNPKFFHGSDTAPHRRGAKENAHCCAGIFNAPVAIPFLVQMFDRKGKLSMLENFTSVFGAQFYNLPLNEDMITLIEGEWEVPELIGDVVPFLAGKHLQWSVEE